MIGTIGWVPGLISKPAAVIAARKRFVLSSSLSRSAVVRDSRSNTAMLAPTAVGGDQFVAAALLRGLLEAALEVGHVVVVVAPALGLAQPHAVDDRGVIECIRDDRVLLGEQRLEHAAVGVEAGGVEQRVLGAEEGRDLLLQRLVQVLGAADEAHRGEPVAVAVERL